jgi:ribosomal protein S18 acetylase RimI-like enzyme
MTQSMWSTRELTDKDEILSFLETDHPYAAYAIGDLEPEMFVHSTWTAAEREGRLGALLLCFRGLNPPVLFLMGEVDGLQVILEERSHPKQAYFTCRAKHLPLTRSFYRWEEVIPMWRMVLKRARFRPVESDCVRLTPRQSEELTELYALGGGDAFTSRQLQRGVFFGIRKDERLVAAAGTHLLSQTYGVAAVGNVFTHPDCRGRGYGTATTSAVIVELLRLGIHDIVLNVAQDSDAAINVYEKLGFEHYCPFLEGRAIQLAN